MKKNIFIIFYVISLILFLGVALALEYPIRPVTLQVPAPAGGGTDTGARILASVLSNGGKDPILWIAIVPEG